MEYRYQHISSPKCGLIYDFNDEKDHFPEYFQSNDKRFFQIEFKRSREKDRIFPTFLKLTSNHWSLFEILTNRKPGFGIKSENGKEKETWVLYLELLLAKQVTVQLSYELQHKFAHYFNHTAKVARISFSTRFIFVNIRGSSAIISTVKYLSVYCSGVPYGTSVNNDILSVRRIVHKVEFDFRNILIRAWKSYRIFSYLYEVRDIFLKDRLGDPKIY